LLVHQLKSRRQVSQKSQQGVVGFIQGQLCRWKVDLLEPVDHQGGFPESGWR